MDIEARRAHPVSFMVSVVLVGYLVVRRNRVRDR